MPLYEIKDSTLLDAHPSRMVEAKNVAAAIRFVASKYTARVMTPMEAAKLAGSGIKVESAGMEPSDA